MTGTATAPKAAGKAKSKKSLAPIAPSSAAPYLVAVVSGAMCFLAVCALETASGAARVSGAWSDGTRGQATVRVPAPDGPEAAGPLAQAALAALADAPGVSAARLMTEEELRALTGPWLGRDGAAAATAAGSTPVFIDVTLAETPPPPGSVQQVLDLTAPGAVYDDHAAWRAPLAQAAEGFRRMVLLSVALMGAALAAMVVTAARASLSGAAATVRTLRLIGARDGFIARAFERPIAVRALVGGAIGAAGALGALAAAPALGLAQALGAAPVTGLGVSLPLALAAPVASAALAFATARLAILAMLRREP